MLSFTANMTRSVAQGYSNYSSNRDKEVGKVERTSKGEHITEHTSG